LKFNGIKNIIFDLDGTLIDSSQGIILATNYALEAIGEPTRRDDEIRSFIGYPLENMFHSFSDGSFDRFWEHFQEKGEDTIADSARPLDSADRVLRALSAGGYNIAIGTQKMRIHIKRILDKLEWASLIDVYVGADDVAALKPAPDVYIKAMNLLGGNTTDSLVIGDTTNDIYAARAAGLPVIGIKSPFGDNQALRECHPDLLIENLEELLNYLE
jgi:phosphoglycolate phosphatase